MFFYSRFIFNKSTFFTGISFVWIVLNSIKSEFPCPYSNRRMTDGFQPSVLPFFTWNTMFLLHVMPCIWWGEGITSFALGQAKTVVIQEMMLSLNDKIIKKKEKRKKELLAMWISRRPCLLWEKKLTVTTESFVVYHYQQPTSVQNCPVWHCVPHLTCK